MNNYEGKVVVCTGAGGIGTTIACRFLQAGATVIVLTRTKESMDKLWDAAKTVDSDPFLRKLNIYVCDITDRPKLVESISHIIMIYKRIDILVNNAGVIQESLLVRTPDEQIDRLIDVNLNGTIYTTKLVAKQMMLQRSGRIVNISSVSGIRGNMVGQAVYAAAKAGVIAFTRNIAMELTHQHINVNAIAPGLIDTSSIQELQKRLQASVMKTNLESTVPLGRLGRPEEIASMVDYLCGPDTSFVTGACFTIDGGASI